MMFPKWKYPPAGSGLEAQIVQDATEEAALEGWTDLPHDYVHPSDEEIAAAQAPEPVRSKSREYPKWKYPPLGSADKSKIVNTKAEEDALVGWFDAPATLHDPGPTSENGGAGGTDFNGGDTVEAAADERTDTGGSGGIRSDFVVDPPSSEQPNEEKQP